MIVHAVDTQFTVQASIYQTAYYSHRKPAPAAPPAQIASNTPVLAFKDVPSTMPAPQHNQAPCSIQRGYADANGWGGVIADCNGSVVSVGGQVPWGGMTTAGDTGYARRVVQRSLESDALGSRHLLLPSALMLTLAALALFFVARSFKEEPYRG